MKKKEELEAIEATLKKDGTRYNTIIAYLEEDNTEKTATFFLRKPDKSCRNLVEGILKKKGGLEAIFACIKNLDLKLGDDTNLLANNDYALASCEEAVVSMLEVQKAILKKN